MCIPPVDEAPAPHFALTAKIAARNGLKNLSMGMSADFADRDPVRRHACARRLGDFRTPLTALLSPCCEERSDEAIHLSRAARWIVSLRSQ